MTSSEQSTGSMIVHFYDPDIQAKDALGRTQEHILAWNNSQLENSHNYIQMLFPLPEGSPFNFAAPVIDLETMKAFRGKSELRQRLRRSFERMLTFYGFTTSGHPKVEEDEEAAQSNDQAQMDPNATSAATTAQSSTEESEGAPASTAPSADETATKDAGTPATADTTSATTGVSNPKSKPQPSTSSYHVVRGPNWAKASRNWCIRFDHNHLRITRILRCLRVLGLQTECDAFYVALKSVYNDPAIPISSRTMMYWTRAVQRPLYLAPDDDEIDWLRTWEAGQVRE